MTGLSDRAKEVFLRLEQIFDLPRIKLVCRDGEIVADATVVVSENDPNWWRSMAVREKGEITLKDGRRLRWQ